MTEYEVIVGNIGSVYKSTSKETALELYRHYIILSDNGLGRAANEDVRLFANGELVSEHKGDKKK
jgi:hypothetical protein